MVSSHLSQPKVKFILGHQGSFKERFVSKDQHDLCGIGSHCHLSLLSFKWPLVYQEK